MTSNQEINLERDGLNELIKNFLVELKNVAHRNASKIEFVYANALKSLRAHKEKITKISDCRKLKYFGDKTCSILDKKLDDYCKKNSIVLPTTSTSSNDIIDSVSDHTTTTAVAAAVRIRIEDEENEQQNNENDDQTNSQSASQTQPPPPPQKKRTTQKTKRQYIPKYRSAGFAIMIALYRLEQDENNYSVSKIDLIKCAEYYFNETTNTTNDNNGGGGGQQLSSSMWTAMKTLIEKELVSVEKSRCNYYSLTDLGRELSVRMYNAMAEKLNLNPITSQHTQTNNDDNENDGQDDLINSEPQIVYLPNSYDIELIIDSREQYTGASIEQKKTKLVSELQNLDINCEMRTLPVGDFAWICKSKTSSAKRELVFDFLVERKKIDDLIASIRDQRWGEQKYRLKRCGIPNIIYLIEGLQSIKPDHPAYKSVHTALANAQLIDKFTVKHTKDLKDTLSYLALMTKYLEKYFVNKSLFSTSKKDKENYPLRENHFMTYNEFSCDSLKITNFTAKEMFVRSLLRFHGSTLEKCKAITNLYSTLPELLEAYDECDNVKEKEQLLTSITYGSTDKKINSNLSKMIYSYFTYTGSME